MESEVNRKNFNEVYTLIYLLTRENDDNKERLTTTLVTIEKNEQEAKALDEAKEAIKQASFSPTRTNYNRKISRRTKSAGTKQQQNSQNNQVQKKSSQQEQTQQNSQCQKER